MPKHLPNVLTMLRLIAIPFFILTALSNQPIVATIIFILACITDYLDGKLARSFNSITDFGKLMDPLADKFLVLSALIILATNQYGYVSWVVVIIISFREFAVTISRYFNKKIIPADMFGKIKTVLQMIGIIAAFLAHILLNYIDIPNSNILVLCIQYYFWIVAIFTLISGIEYFIKMKFLTIIICLSVLSCSKTETETIIKAHSAEQILAQPNNTLIINSRKPRAWGRPQTIYVFADDDLWQMTQPFISYSLERKFFTTENEQLFFLQHENINNLKNFDRFNNLVFLGDINSNQPVSQFLNQIMGQQTIDSVKDKNASMFMNYNLWASDQMVMFFMGNSPESIRQFLYDNNETYFRLFYDRFVARITHSSKRLKAIDTSIFNDLPFYMYIPTTYRVFKKDLDNNYVTFLWRSREDQTENPDKYISIYWEKVDYNPLDDNWLFEKRKELAWKIYDEDEFAEDDVRRGLKDFGKREAWFLLGRWQNQKYLMGGAFQSFAFYENGFVFMVDTSVYFPAGDKLRYIIELEQLTSAITIK